ncbi:Hypothetical predicted protein [Cloeon dipterum]|uniref:Uncharacterized protein n=1 Tax=Cloeon dipterum TaxID=197152 RepID=A0A8S1DVK6_9INSE|nr:Hypothetical predicted protein [Cloeon dipterum]
MRQSRPKNLFSDGKKSKITNMDSNAKAMYSAVNHVIFKAANGIYSVMLSCFDKLKKQNCVPDVKVSCVLTICKPPTETENI